MKNVIFTLVVLSMGIPVLAALECQDNLNAETGVQMSSGPTLDGLECTKGQDVLSAEIGAHMGSGPTLYGLKLNDAFNGKEYDTFTDILVNSGKCLDIQPDVPVKGKEIFICEGELFAPNGGFGQVFLTSGSIEVFKNRLAPISNWHCK